MKGLKGKIAIITGAAQGIGQSTALRLAQEGVNLGLIDKNSLGETEKILKKFPVKVLTLKSDISNQKKVGTFFNLIEKKLGGIDILINNAGVYDRVLLADVDEKHWDKMIGTNLKGAFFCSKLAAPYMMKKQGGRVIFISSISAFMGGKSSLIYSLSKSGLFGLNRALSVSLAPHNITVNTIMPGITETEMIKNIPKNRIEDLKNATVLKRLAKPSEIASVIAFVASEESSYITGAIINASGGMVY